MARKIYVASSWRNPYYVEVLAELKHSGHECYDFRNPAPGDTGFAWEQVDENWKNWTIPQYMELVKNHPTAKHGFNNDKEGLDWCDTCVLVMPSGRSAHIEAGYAAGEGKEVFVLLHEDKFEPDLMYLLGTDMFHDLNELKLRLKEPVSRKKGMILEGETYTELVALHERTLELGIQRGREQLRTQEGREEFCAMGLAGEAGELANLYKKTMRGQPIPREEFVMETADCGIHFFLQCYELKLDPHKIIKDKLKIYRKRLEEGKI